MLYLTTQHPVHENLMRVLFSNATLEKAGEHYEDRCRIMAINTLVIGVPIRVTQAVVATAFDMLDSGRSDAHKGFLVSMLIPHDNAPDLPLHKRLLHFFISHCFRPIARRTPRYARLTTGLCTMLIPHDNALDLPLHERLLHLFISHCFRPKG